MALETPSVTLSLYIYFSAASEVYMDLHQPSTKYAHEIKPEEIPQRKLDLIFRRFGIYLERATGNGEKDTDVDVDIESSMLTSTVIELVERWPSTLMKFFKTFLEFASVRPAKSRDIHFSR
eukprot:1342977-Amorphochlora_amoeboformis.AAC.1